MRTKKRVGIFTSMPKDNIVLIEFEFNMHTYVTFRYDFKGEDYNLKFILPDGTSHKLDEVKLINTSLQNIIKQTRKKAK